MFWFKFKPSKKENKLRLEKNEPSKKRRDKAKSLTGRHTYEERHRWRRRESHDTHMKRDIDEDEDEEEERVMIHIWRET